MNVLNEADLPVPKIFINNLEMVINMEMKEFFKQSRPFTSKLEKLAKDARKWNIPLDKDEIGFNASTKLLQVIEELRSNLFDIKYISSINRVLKVLDNLDIHPDIWKSQNGYFYVSKKILTALETADLEEDKKENYKEQLIMLGNYLKVNI
jgi:hypothetical protein